VDLNTAAINVIKANLKTTRLETNARVHQMDAFRFLESPQTEQFDYIYIAPPQYKEMWIKALQMVDQRLELLSEDGWVVVQIHPVELAEVKLTNLHEFDRREYGSTVVLFYARNDLV
jgi:16S rRNA G966 N2-methylase RsmD